MYITDRRTAIRQFVYLSAGLALLPSCLQDKSKSSFLLKNFTISGEQESFLGELSETIIPATDTPGAKDLSAHLFVLKMVDDCYKKEDREKFVRGMEAFGRAVQTATGKHFGDATEQERAAFLKALEDRKAPELKQDKGVGTEQGKDGEMAFFYRTVKHLTIQAYTTSPFYLTKVHVYKLVPGRFHGCVPVGAGS
ncbi:MAG TPA: gluconate 2-dehydrogenase subunit 3 family protein [Puia sp.]|nr:gluconate 2-dehydrogenase subunit 3 family protein [Puia sp.]